MCSTVSTCIGGVLTAVILCYLFEVCAAFAAPADARREVIAEFQYPPTPLQGVPAQNDSVDRKRAYCVDKFPQYLPPMGPGMTDVSVDHLCYLHRIANRPDAWPCEFNNWCDAWAHWGVAADILGREGHDIQHILTGIRFGDNPGWIIQPNTDLILCEERCPESAAGLEQLLSAVVKNIRGKSSDPSETSVCDGPCTVPAPRAVARLARVYECQFELYLGLLVMRATGDVLPVEAGRWN